MTVATHSPEALVPRIVQGATDDDPVRLHGAIVATLEHYTIADADSLVFAAVLEELEDRPAAHHAAMTAIRRQTAAYRHLR